MIKTCRLCGKSFDDGGHYRVYCSPECQHENNVRRSKAFYVAHRVVPGPRTCPICGKTFEVAHGLVRYCSKQCVGIAASRRHAAKRLANLVSRTCPVCGRQYATPSERPKLYCSKTCQQRSHRGSKILKKTCPVCGKEFETFRSRRVTCSDACKELFHDKRVSEFANAEVRTCAWCGKSFKAFAGKKKSCCSRSCSARHSRYGSPEELTKRQLEKREAALAKAAARRMERERARRRTHGLTDEQMLEVARAQDGDQSKLWEISRGWTPEQRKYAVARYKDKHGLHC